MAVNGLSRIVKEALMSVRNVNEVLMDTSQVSKTCEV